MARAVPSLIASWADIVGEKGGGGSDESVARGVRVSGLEFGGGWLEEEVVGLLMMGRVLVVEVVKEVEYEVVLVVVDSLLDWAVLEELLDLAVLEELLDLVFEESLDIVFEVLFDLVFEVLLDLVVLAEEVVELLFAEADGATKANPLFEPDFFCFLDFFSTLEALGLITLVFCCCCCCCSSSSFFS